MKNNRQIGLDGKIFISTSMHRGTFFVFLLMLYGIVAATADILKLTGASGVAMGSFTTTLLIYDFIVSLLLVVVVFYAYFLECGADVPVIKEKPLLLFGFFRLGYYLLLAYYLCYRMLYCAVNRDTVSTSVCIFYAVYLCLIVILILANCNIFNILTRNLIRRSYKKSFHRLAVAGFIIQALLPISYIVARFLMEDIGDEYFTTAVCDLVRLLIAPMLLTSVWFLFLHGVEQVNDVYSEVDSALKGKRYQITYSSGTSSEKGSKRKGQTAPPATATLLPAGAAASVFSDSEPKALTSAAVPSENSQSVSNDSPVKNDVIEASIAAEIQETAAAVSGGSETAPASSTAVSAQPETTEKNDDEIVAEFASEARKAVAMTSAQNQKKPTQNQKKSGSNNKKNKQPNAPLQPALPVQEFDPYPAASVPLRPQSQAQRPQGNPQRANPQNRPAQKNASAQRPRPASPQNHQARPQQRSGQNNGQQRPVQNSNRANQQRPAPNNQQRQGGQPAQRPNGQRPQQNNTRHTPHR